MIIRIASCVMRIAYRKIGKLSFEVSNGEYRI